METGEGGRPIIVALDTIVLAQEAPVVTVFVESFLEGKVGEVERLLDNLLTAEWVTHYDLHVTRARVAGNVHDVHRARLHPLARHHVAVNLDFYL